MGELHHLYLIPGFFGFTNLGEPLYFAHVRNLLPEICTDLGLNAVIHQVQTHPTASLRLRAERLLEVIAETASGDDNPIHLIGHSSGGLDARLAVSPGVSLRGSIDAEPFASRVRTIVTISTPHYGTPVAKFFSSLLGQQLLGLLSLGTVYVLRFGRLPTSVIFKLAALFARLDDVVGLKNNVLDQLSAQLLSDFSPEKAFAIEQLLGDMSSDQSLIQQLAPEGIDVFNATTLNREGVRYGSVIHYARNPGVLSTWAVGLDPYGQATHALFFGLYRLASRFPKKNIPELNEQQMAAFLDTFGIIPQRNANDGVVPTLSQVWGEIIHATRADHLDVLGHFGDPKRIPPHIDWLSTGSGFDRNNFEALWIDVVRFILGKSSIGTRHQGQHEGSPVVQHLIHLFKR